MFLQLMRENREYKIMVELEYNDKYFNLLNEMFDELEFEKEKLIDFDGGNVILRWKKFSFANAIVAHICIDYIQRICESK